MDLLQALGEFTIGLGDVVMVASQRIGKVVPGKVVFLSEEPGRQIGVDVGREYGLHNCQGCCEAGCGIFATPGQVIPADKYEEVAAEADVFLGAPLAALSLDKVTVKDGKIVKAE